MSLNRDQILNKNDFDIHKMHVTEWGGDIYLRPMSGKHREIFESIMIDDSKSKVEKLKDFRALLTVFCVCDKDGNLIFEPDDIVKLSEKSSAVLEKISTVAQKISMLTESDADELLGKSEGARA